MADIRDINKAIYAINSSAVFHIGAENSADVLDSCTIEWLEGTTPISKADIQTKMDELQAEYDAQSYVRNRVDGVSGSYAASQGTGSIYPSTGEQLDMLYWDKINNTEVWKETVDKILVTNGYSTGMTTKERKEAGYESDKEVSKPENFVQIIE